MRCLDVGGGNIKVESFIYEGSHVLNPFCQTPQDPSWTSINIFDSTKPDVLANARSLPFRSGTFNFLRGWHFPLSEINNETLLEFYRVLKPGGVCLIVTGHLDERLHKALKFSSIFSHVSFSNKNATWMGIKV